VSDEPQPAESAAPPPPSPTWKRHLRFRWSLLILFTVVAGAAIGIKVRRGREAKAREEFPPAVRACDIGTMERCLDAAPFLTAYRFEDGFTALHVASMSGHLDMTTLLIHRGADLEARAGGLTPLHWAAFSGHAEIVRLLIEANADARVGRIHGSTPLHAALDFGHAKGGPMSRQQLATVKLLIDNGADWNALDHDHNSPKDITRSQFPEVFQELDDYAAKKRASE